MWTTGGFLSSLSGLFILYYVASEFKTQVVFLAGLCYFKDPQSSACSKAPDEFWVNQMFPSIQQTLHAGNVSHLCLFPSGISRSEFPKRTNEGIESLSENQQLGIQSENVCWSTEMGIICSRRAVILISGTSTATWLRFILHFVNPH